MTQEVDSENLTLAEVEAETKLDAPWASILARQVMKAIEPFRKIWDVRNDDVVPDKK